MLPCAFQHVTQNLLVSPIAICPALCKQYVSCEVPVVCPAVLLAVHAVVAGDTQNQAQDLYVLLPRNGHCSSKEQHWRSGFAEEVAFGAATHNGWPCVVLVRIHMLHDVLSFYKLQRMAAIAIHAVECICFNSSMLMTCCVQS